MQIAGASVTSHRGRVFSVSTAVETHTAGRPGILNRQASRIDDSIEADLRAVVKERMVHRHVRRVRSALIDERVATVATFGVAPVPGGGLLKLSAVVLRPANHHELIGGMDGNTFKLQGVERGAV